MGGRGAFAGSAHNHARARDSPLLVIVRHMKGGFCESRTQARYDTRNTRVTLVLQPATDACRVDASL